MESPPWILTVIFSRTGSIFLTVPPINDSFSFGSGPGAKSSPTSVGSFSPALAPGRIVVVGVCGAAEFGCASSVSLAGAAVTAGWSGAPAVLFEDFEAEGGFVVLRVSAEDAAGAVVLVSVAVPGVVRPPVLTALPAGRCPEGGVLGRPEGVCALAQITTGTCKMPVTRSTRKKRNIDGSCCSGLKGTALLRKTIGCKKLSC